MRFTTKTEEALRELIRNRPDSNSSEFDIFERHALSKMLDDPYIPDVIRKAMRACAFDRPKQRLQVAESQPAT